MTFRLGRLATRILPAAAAATAMLTLSTPSASAAHDDSFYIFTVPGGCGAAHFVDYGEGAPGGGKNDDYVLVHDYCADGHGVKAWAWLDGNYRGGKYNGSGLAGPPVVWDPFGNVAPGQAIGLKACLVDGNDDPTPFNCAEGTVHSIDG